MIKKLPFLYIDVCFLLMTSFFFFLGAVTVWNTMSPMCIMPCLLTLTETMSRSRVSPSNFFFPKKILQHFKVVLAFSLFWLKLTSYFAL